MKTINERLKEYREILNLTQDYVSKQLNISKEAFIMLEAGIRTVTLKDVKVMPIYMV